MADCDNFMWDPAGKITGETQDSFFSTKKAFEIDKWSSLKVENDWNQAEQKYTGKCKFEKIKIEKVVDSASSLLYRYCSKGEAIPALMLASRIAGASAIAYLQYQLGEVTIVSVEWEGGSGKERAKETLTLHFKALGMQYIQQGNDGRPVARKGWSWNTMKIDEKGSMLEGPHFIDEKLELTKRL